MPKIKQVWAIITLLPDLSHTFTATRSGAMRKELNMILGERHNYSELSKADSENHSGRTPRSADIRVAAVSDVGADSSSTVETAALEGSDAGVVQIYADGSVHRSSFSQADAPKARVNFTRVAAPVVRAARSQASLSQLEQKGGRKNKCDGVPESGTCIEVTLKGTYSGNRLMECSGNKICSTEDTSSCPLGWKLFSPQSQTDWTTVFASAKDPSSPQAIVDVTKETDGCGGCTKHPMNSNTAEQNAWRTSDGTPWFLRDGKYSEPNGDYKKNCYLKFAWNTEPLAFNDAMCKYCSDKYLCQPSKALGYRDCEMGLWTQWKPCSCTGDKATGKKTRKRTKIVSADCGGLCNCGTDGKAEETTGQAGSACVLDEEAECECEQENCTKFTCDTENGWKDKPDKSSISCIDGKCEGNPQETCCDPEPSACTAATGTGPSGTYPCKCGAKVCKDLEECNVNVAGGICAPPGTAAGSSKSTAFRRVGMPYSGVTMAAVFATSRIFLR